MERTKLWSFSRDLRRPEYSTFNPTGQKKNLLLEDGTFQFASHDREKIARSESLQEHNFSLWPLCCVFTTRDRGLSQALHVH